MLERTWPDRLVYEAVGLGLIGVLGVTGASLLLLDDDPPACPEGRAVSVAAAPEIEPAVSEAVRRITARDGCADYLVKATRPVDVATGRAGTAAELPDVWIPDSSTWFSRTGQAVPKPVPIEESLAKSPVVLVGGPAAKRPDSWIGGLSTGRVMVTDPAITATGTAALLGLRAERGETHATDGLLDGVLVNVAQEYGARKRTLDAPSALLSAAARPGSRMLAVASEQGFLRFVHDNPDTAAVATTPRTGTPVLDFPMALLGGGVDARGAADRLAEFLGGPAGAPVLEANLLRRSDGAALAAGVGVGHVDELAPPARGRVVSELLRLWQVLTVPSRVLTVFDVSGSMDLLADGQSRISLAVDAAATGLQLLPDSSSAGLWAFSEGLARGTDHRSLVPIRRLTASAGGQGQRDVLRRAGFGLADLTGGGTALYDTTLAAVRHLQAHYDPNAVNAVVLLTDGRNDDPVSIGLTELLETLKREHDAARPVEVIAIGMGPDADAGALSMIAEVTDGHSYTARDPGDVKDVYLESLLAR